MNPSHCRSVDDASEGQALTGAECNQFDAQEAA
jgi:hypothetical protein